MNVHGFIPATRIIGALFMLPAVGALGLAIYFFSSTRAFIDRSVTCRGQVVEMIQSQGQDGATFTPAFTFMDANGAVHRGQASWSSNPPTYSVGDSIALRYDRANPADVRIDSFWSIWAGVWICLAVLIIPLITSLIFLFLVPFTIRRVWPQATPTVI
jgi:hypothetical protein